MFHSERSFKDFLLGMVIGGSMSALLFKTERGKKIQKDILTKYRKMSQKANHFLKKEIKKKVIIPRSKRKKKRNPRFR